ncbi:hypothetical protein J5N97_006359 [Dioscorea zingiberensis]|uniref:ABC transporter domain-containing protein n=1 Tax=Dioscorea zingiberensis TaxID=325984 RepID=A0A9D5DA11_9LILI|nr:hypothetical protein J5N97_006359 [Dioscorea zingiberensis]
MVAVTTTGKMTTCTKLRGNDNRNAYFSSLVLVLRIQTIEVRFEHLDVRSEVNVGDRVIFNSFYGVLTCFNFDSAKELLHYLHVLPSRKRQITILDGISGVIKPRRMTLLLGPPGSGKTTLLLALAGKLDSNLKVSGRITYNGHGMDEFVPQRTSAYISQHDVHIGEMTVRETLAFSAKCQGVGTRYEMLTELSRREKAANIKPDPDIDMFMKILGLDICAISMIGDAMLRGISGGQKEESYNSVLEDRMHRDSVEAGVIFMGALSTGLLVHILNGFSDLAMSTAKLPVFYKQRDLLYPAWVYALPTWILKIPISFLESAIYVAMTYYVIGFDSSSQRMIRQFLLFALVSQMASGLFRVVAACGRDMVLASTFGCFLQLIVIVLGGFVMSRHNIKKWWIWGYWSSPLMYAQNAIAVNEFLGKSWKQEMKAQGVKENQLVLLNGVNGAFRPGVLTALMGVSGAGKTTLMDVLAGRKTGGLIEGNIYISGYPKKQETFARISGYCEQTDIHSPHMTVYESLVYSAWLRLPSEIKLGTRKMFIEEVMEVVELTQLKKALVGLPGVSGLSTEQRKRLTIAVELVANPSIIFMDEPTSGLDARAAAIVMRTVRNTVNTGRTVGIKGVDKIKDGYNPATWMLEVTTLAQEDELGISFSEIYKNSDLFRYRPDVRINLLETWLQKENTQQDLFNAMGSMYSAVLFIGIQNSQMVQPIVDIERTVFYREKAAGMYSALPFAYAQVAIEIPYTLFQTLLYGILVYSMINLEWTLIKFMWYLFFMFFTFLYFTYYGMMAVSMTPNSDIAAILSSAFYAIWNLFAGFIIPHPRLPVWWKWYFWASPSFMDFVWTLCFSIWRQEGSNGHSERQWRKVLEEILGIQT